MVFDNEQDVLTYTYMVCMNNPLMFTGNSFEKKIYKAFQDADALVPNNAKDDLPPDYYSDIHSMMFDVMRINDTEVKRTYNPVKIRERNMERELQQSGILDAVAPDCKVVCTSESYDVDEHNYKAYEKNTGRVMQDHIDKIPIWVQEHPNVKYKGLFVFDETECYYEGSIHYLGDDKFLRVWDANHLVLHEPWNDEPFIQKAYDSDLDFVIWVCAYKQFSEPPRQMHVSYPSIVIMDVRYPRTRKYSTYNVERLVV